MIQRIDKIELHNFQCHRYLEVDFRDGINVIVGDNNSGKSAIVRAIGWILMNDPPGDWMRTIQPDGKLATTKVVLHAGGRSITRIKSDNRNSYFLDDDAFEGVGRNIPDSIQEFIGLTKIDINGTTIAPFYSGPDAPQFMISSDCTDTFRAQLLNHLTGGDVITRATKLVKEEVASNGACIQIASALIRDAQERVAACKPVYRASKAVTAAERLEKRLDKCVNYISELCEIKDSLSRFRITINLQTGLSRCEKLFEDIDIAYLKMSTICASNEDEVEKLIECCDKVCEDIKHYDELVKDLTNVGSLIEISNNSLMTTRRLLGELDDVNKEIEKLNKLINRCPTCGALWEK